jgi:hypothetical protein
VLSVTARETIGWDRFFRAIQFDTEQPLQINCDNLQTIRILEKSAQKLSTKLRHIDIYQHWLRREIERGRIKLRWITTAEMPADGLTKSLLAQKQCTFVKQLNLVNIKEALDRIQKQTQTAESSVFRLSTAYSVAE